MRNWAAYAGAALLIGLCGVTVALVVGSGETVLAVVLSAAVAWGIQAVAFALLVRVKDRTDLFMVAWLGGIVLRFAAVGVVAFWVTRRGTPSPTVTLVSLVAFVFVMVMVEPLFLRKGRSTG